MIRAIDYSALTGPVTPAQTKAFRESVRNRPEYATTSAIIAAIVVILTLFILGFIAFGFIAVGIFGIGGIGGILVSVLLVTGFIALGILAVRSAVGSGKWERWMRLEQFASANGLIFSPVNADPHYPGAIFQLGRSRTAVDHFRSASDRFLDYGNYRYTTGSGKNQSTRTWGFMALQLDRALPNMVLDSKANNGFFGSNLPATFSKSQVLHLEGDFDQHFTLYCPQQYERDALYVFTPDLMALLIDAASVGTGQSFDVEIVDKWMFVYSSSAFDLRQPAIHQRLLDIVDTVGTKTLRQTGRYADERVGDFAANIVAPQGRRLKRGVSVGAIIAVIVVAGFWVWPFFGAILTAVVSR